MKAPVIDVRLVQTREGTWRASIEGRLVVVGARDTAEALAVVSADLANRTGRCIAAHRLRDADGYGLVTSSLRGHAATVRRLPMETLAGATESDVDAWIAEDGAAADCGADGRP